MTGQSNSDRLPAIMRDTMLGLVRKKGADLSSRQLAVLLVSYMEDGPHTIRGLAQRLNLPKSAISRALDRLEQSDLVRREPDPLDRRSVLVCRRDIGAGYIADLEAAMQSAAIAHGTQFKAVPVF